MPVQVQTSGGLASRSDVEAVLDAGAARAVLGSGALADRNSTTSLIAEFGGSLVIGLEVEGERLRPRGRSETDLPVGEVLAWLADAGATRYLLTEIDRVGSLARTGVEAVRALAAALSAPMLVAGGIASEEDLRALIDLGPPVEGVVVGRALLEGRVSLPALLHAAAAQPGATAS